MGKSKLEHKTCDKSKYALEEHKHIVGWEEGIISVWLRVTIPPSCSKNNVHKNI